MSGKKRATGEGEAFADRVVGKMGCLLSAFPFFLLFSLPFHPPPDTFLIIMTEFEFHGLSGFFSLHQIPDNAVDTMMKVLHETLKDLHLKVMMSPAPAAAAMAPPLPPPPANHQHKPTPKTTLTKAEKEKKRYAKPSIPWLIHLLLSLKLALTSCCPSWVCMPVIPAQGSRLHHPPCGPPGTPRGSQRLHSLGHGATHTNQQACLQLSAGPPRLRPRSQMPS